MTSFHVLPSSFHFLGVLLSFLNTYAIFWLPFVLGYIAWTLWIDYRQQDYISKLKWTMLEVLLPQEIHKTPLAMEVALTALHDPRTGNWLEKYFQGRVMTWSSLELVSIEGSVKFFLRIPSDTKNNVEAKIYSQFPGIEIYEVKDYTGTVDYRDGTWSLFGAELALTKPDPYPIKTYIDYGINQPDMKAETQIDPIAPTIEFLGSLGPGEQVWTQILVQAARKRFSKKGSMFQKADWKEKANEIVSGLKGEEGSFNQLTIGEQNAIGSIQRAIGKLGFDCGFRMLYLAKRESFNGANIGGMIGTIKQYATENSNSLYPKVTTKFEFPWQDYKNTRLESMKRSLYDAYCKRAYFYAPHKKKPFVLNTEELATVYHFPARVTDGPGFARIESEKSQPPANLPV